MKNVALSAFFLAGLVACAAPRGGNGPYSPGAGSLYERQVIGALDETKVSSAERQAVLAAFDAMSPKLQQNDADNLRVQRRWESLDPRTANYAAEADAVAQQAAAVAAERLKALAQFNQKVAGTLSASQWATWTRVMSDQRAAFENGRRLDPTFRPEERGR